MASYHKAFVNGLLRSILSTGDGRTPETAIVVMSVEEEYDVLHFLGLTAVAQALVALGGDFRRLDRVTAKTKTGELLEVYFDPKSLRRADRTL